MQILGMGKLKERVSYLGILVIMDYRSGPSMGNVYREALTIIGDPNLTSVRRLKSLKKGYPPS